MPTHELTAGDPAVVGPYRLRGRLGSGGMGVVYLADDRRGEPIAVKCLPPGVGPDVRTRLQREADFLSAVNHPRVAAFVDADVHGDRPWIAMQYIAGPSLAQAAVPLGPAQVRHLAAGLAEALQALHRQGLTHRDVKPGNIILTHGGPVLVDLGIAATTDLTGLTAVGMVVGTPEWMAPEQLTGYATGFATDVWGWACVLTFAATGRTPFGSGPMVALAHRIRHDEPDLRGLPDWLRGAVTVGLAKDPRLRPTAAALAVPDGVAAVSTAAYRRGPGVAGGRAPLDPRRPVQARPPAPIRSTPPVPAPPIRTAAPIRTAPPPPARTAPPPGVRPRQPQTAGRAPMVVPPGRPASSASAPRRTGNRTAPPRPLPPRVRASGSRAVPKPRPAPRRRRSPAQRALRSVLLLVLVVLTAVVVGVGAYAAVRHAVSGGSWPDQFTHLYRQISST